MGPILSSHMCRRSDDGVDARKVAVETMPTPWAPRGRVAISAIDGKGELSPNCVIGGVDVARPIGVLAPDHLAVRLLIVLTLSPPTIEVLPIDHRPLGLRPRAAGWSAATSCIGPGLLTLAFAEVGGFPGRPVIIPMSWHWPPLTQLRHSTSAFFGHPVLV